MIGRILFIALITCQGCFSQDVFESVRSGDTDRLEVLYRMNPDTLEAANSNGFTPLIIATYRNQLACVKFLVEHNVDVNRSSQEGTALVGACYKGNLEIIRLLLDNGADVNAAGDNGTTALIYAVLANNKKLVELLIEYKADPKKRDNKGLSSLEYASKMDETELVKIMSNSDKYHNLE